MNLKIGELEFILLRDDDDTRAYAQRLADLYGNRLSAVSDWLFSEPSFGRFFADAGRDQIPAGLGAPLFTLLGTADGTVTFPCAEFGSQRHLISFEFSGALEEFYDLSVDV